MQCTLYLTNHRQCDNAHSSSLKYNISKYIKMVNNILLTGPFKISHKWTPLTQREVWMWLRPRLRRSAWSVDTRGSTFSQRARPPTHLSLPPSAERLGVCAVYLSRARVDSRGSRLLFLLAVECVPVAPPNKESAACLPYWSTASGRPAQNFHVSFPLTSLAPLLTSSKPCNLSTCQGQTPPHTLTHAHTCLHLPDSVCVRLCTQSSSGVCEAGGWMTRLNTQYEMHKRLIYDHGLVCHRRRQRSPQTHVLRVFTGGCSSPRWFFKHSYAYLSDRTWYELLCFAHFTLLCHHRQTFCCCVPPQVLGAERVLLRQTQGGREGGLPQHPVLCLARVFNWLQRAVEEAQ